MPTETGTRYVSVAEAARRLEVSPSTVWRWIDARKLPAERVGSRIIRIREQDLDLVIQPARPERSESKPAKPDHSVAVHPTKDELARRREAYERIVEIRRKLSTLPITATEALERVDEMQREHDERLAGIRR